MAWIEPIIAGLFACTVIGYLWGYKRGELFGQEVAALYAPLEIRKQSLLTGECQICGSHWHDPSGFDENQGAMTDAKEKEMRECIYFTKMHGIGNDYVYIDLFRHDYQLNWQEVAQLVSDRHVGIGSDGLILIMPSQRADARMRIFNADGSEGEMCGNGIRCVGKYLYDTGIVRKTKMTIETLAGDCALALLLDEHNIVSEVTVDMGEPRLTREEIPVLGEPADQMLQEEIKVFDQFFKVTAVSMGNPHAVVFLDEAEGPLEKFPVKRIGKAIENNNMFPERTNVEFVIVKSPDELVMRVWERGSGETLACGTGACAAAVAAHLLRKSNQKVTVHLSGGDLFIEWRNDNHVYMTGPAAFVFSGQVNLNSLRKKRSNI